MVFRTGHLLLEYVILKDKKEEPVFPEPVPSFKKANSKPLKLQPKVKGYTFICPVAKREREREINK